MFDDKFIFYIFSTFLFFHLFSITLNAQVGSNTCYYFVRMNIIMCVYIFEILFRVQCPAENV